MRTCCAARSCARRATSRRGGFEFAYERSSQEDLQRWSRAAFAPFAAPPAALEIGVADLGFVTGFWSLEPGGTRWTRGAATLLLAAPPGAGARITLELRAASACRRTGSARSCW
ncbi:MAG: hypothetical protein U0Z44_16265 [Kouleothrix sp.]